MSAPSKLHAVWNIEQASYSRARLDGLREMHLVAGEQRPLAVVGPRVSRQRDCRNIPRFSVAQRPDLLNQLIAVEVRHADSLTLRNPLMTAFMAVNVLQKTAPAGAERELKRL
jgi:hypothetical protein